MAATKSRDAFDQAIEDLLDCLEVEYPRDGVLESPFGEIENLHSFSDVEKWVYIAWNFGGYGVQELLALAGYSTPQYCVGLSPLLFLCCSPTGSGGYCPPKAPGWRCGCLTQIRGDAASAYTAALTDEIFADRRLNPTPLRLAAALEAESSRDRRRRLLEPYAEWQRRLRREFREEETLLRKEAARSRVLQILGLPLVAKEKPS